MALLAALADEGRLRVFAEVVRSAGTTPVVAASLGLREKDAIKLLSRLESVGLIEQQGATWMARPQVLRDAVAAASTGPEPVDHGARDPATAAVLRAFLPHGRLERMPSARGKRLVVLDHIAMVFEPGVHYAEKDVNVLLTAFHPDFASLRRHLVDEGFLTRESGAYWRSGGTVDL